MELAKELKIKKKKIEQKANDKRLRTEQEHLHKYENLVGEHIEMKKKKLANDCKTKTEVLDVDCENKPMTKRKRSKPILLINAGGAEERLKVPPHTEIDSSLLPDIDLEDLDVQIFRTHNYYSGWVDCIKATESLHAYRTGRISKEKVAYIFDINDYRSPDNAGVTAGANFTWSAMC